MRVLKLIVLQENLLGHLGMTESFVLLKSKPKA